MNKANRHYHKNQFSETNKALLALIEKQSELIDLVKHTSVGEVDITLNNLHAFIRREFLFELDKWFQSEIGVTNVQSITKTSSLIGDLKNPEAVENRITIMASLIISKMSDTIKAQFHAVYADDESESGLLDYVVRQLLFFIKKVNTDISILFESDETQDINTANILETYFLSIENEIYNNNNIEITNSFIIDTDNDSSNKSTKESSEEEDK